MYENTDARTHRVAAALIEAGVDVDDTYRRLYEHVPLEKLRLVARALEGIERHCDGALVITYITAERLRGDRRRRGDDRGDHRLPALGRGGQGRGGGPRPRQPRARRAQGQPALERAATSTSRRSPASKGGGGHVRAAGFSTDLTYEELVEFLCAEVGGQLAG